MTSEMDGQTMELISREAVNKLLSNQREMQSRVNQLPTYDACYLGSPCEYQNPDIKIPKCVTLTDEAYSDLCLRASRSIEWHEYPKEKPTKEGTYLVTVKYEDEEEACVLTSIFVGTYNCFGGGRFVTAWAERPEPYRKENADGTECDNDCEHCDWVTCPKAEEGAEE